MSSIGLRLTALTCFLSPLAFACSGLSTGVPQEQQQASLSRAASCEDLTVKLQEDAIARVRETARGLRSGDYWGRGVDDSGEFGGPGDPNAGGGGQSGGGEAPPSGHSDTNTQVAGVDEADIVKTDGERLWLLHGQELMVIDAWPPQSIAVEQALTIEGSPYEMFVAEGKAIVFSTAYLEVPGTDPSGSDPGRPGASEPGFGDEAPYYGTSFTKLTVVDLGGGSPKAERELYFEGNYTSSRRYGSKVRAVVSGGLESLPYQYWEMPYGDSLSSTYQLEVAAWEARVINLIRQRDVSSWLPRTLEAKGGQFSQISHACNDYFVPAPGGTAEGLTRVVTLDLLDPSKLSESSVLGYAQQLYSNGDKLILAQAEYTQGFWDGSGEHTALHMFSLSGDHSVYEASGLVPGHLDDQFSIDERAGVVRVATTTWGNTGDDSENRILALRNQGGSLAVVGDTGPLAVGEQIFSARFVGDRGYLVTFRQTDPLFVVDLKDPTALKVLGELHIPGFSDYMHPLDSDHLVTIGRNRGDDGVSEDALALQIFDVSNPTAPALAHKHVFRPEGWSTANYDHKAFTFYGDKQLMAFPFSGYSERGYEASLEVFRVSAEAGFSKLGSADHAGFGSCSGQSTEPCYDEYYGHEVRRGVFIDEYVYSISGGGILVHSLSDMSAPIATLPLPYSSGGGAYPGGGTEF